MAQAPTPALPADRPDHVGAAEQTALQSTVLEDLSSAVNYQAWLASLVEPWLGPDPLEIGSGHGDYAAIWAERGHRMTVSEADGFRLAQLRERFAEHPLVRVRHLSAPVEEGGDYTAAVALNVLEHIEDDVAALRSFRDLVRGGGHVALVVPAFTIGMSEFDRSIGHFRRYRVRELRRKLEAAGLQPVMVRYLNPLGLIAWVIVMRLLRRRPRDTALLRGYDRLVVPVLRRLDGLAPSPFGQSVVAIASVPGPPAGAAGE